MRIDTRALPHSPECERPASRASDARNGPAAREPAGFAPPLRLLPERASNDAPRTLLAVARVAGELAAARTLVTAEPTLWSPRRRGVAGMGLATRKPTLRRRMPRCRSRTGPRRRAWRAAPASTGSLPVAIVDGAPPAGERPADDLPIAQDAAAAAEAAAPAPSARHRTLTSARRSAARAKTRRSSRPPGLRAASLGCNPRASRRSPWRRLAPRGR
jgi:hypothetical protein